MVFIVFKKEERNRKEAAKFFCVHQPLIKFDTIYGVVYISSTTIILIWLLVDERPRIVATQFLFLFFFSYFFLFHINIVVAANKEQYHCWLSWVIFLKAHFQTLSRWATSVEASYALKNTCPSRTRTSQIISYLSVPGILGRNQM